MFATRKILLNLELTPSCPAKCAMCPRDLVHESGFMSLETMNAIMDQVSADWVWEVDVAGRGEPTIHPKFFEMSQLMARGGAPTCVVTTGVTMTKKNADAMEHSFDLVRLSVSSIERSIFEQVHIGLDFDKIWRNIRFLAEAAASKTIIHLTGGPVIYPGLHDTVAHLRKLGFERMHLLPLWNRGGSLHDLASKAKRTQLMKELGLMASEREAWAGTTRSRFITRLGIQKLKNSHFCPIGDASLSLSYDGKVLGCFQDFGHTSNVGHISSMSLRDHVERRVVDLGNMAICQGCNSRNVTQFS